MDRSRALARKGPSPIIARGRAHTWACGVMYASWGRSISWLTRIQDPHLRADELCERFGGSQSTGGGKARVIRDALKVDVFDPKWSLPSPLDTHPTAWMIMG